MDPAANGTATPAAAARTAIPLTTTGNLRWDVFVVSHAFPGQNTTGDR